MDLRKSTAISEAKKNFLVVLLYWMNTAFIVHTNLPDFQEVRSFLLDPSLAQESVP